jgi:hypothetical protein
MFDMFIPKHKAPPTIVYVGGDNARDAIEYCQANYKYGEECSAFPIYGSEEICWRFTFNDRSKATLFALMFKGR